MFRMINNHKRTGSVAKCGLVVAMCDDGWEDIVDFKFQAANEQAGREYLIASGYEEYDPNAELKAMGLKWNGYMYA